MNADVSKRIRVAVAGAVALFVTMAVPQVAQAAGGSGAHANRGAAASAPAQKPSGGAAPGGAASGAASGSDASCPPASSAAAGSATVGAPQRARAIGGSASATVVWCPPAAGAGSVVSYTVTSSGGQQVTAAVPNDWAIVDGLTDGTSYTFTVKAHTASGAASAAATSNAVTPEPIAPPASVLRGAPQTVGYDQYSMTIGGHRLYVTAGEFDPWRTPSPSLAR